MLRLVDANGMKPRRHSQAAKRGGRTSAAERKIIVYIATSADGYIARPDGSVDWLNRPVPKGAYGMAAFAPSIDTILWGRKTYDFAATMGESAPMAKSNTMRFRANLRQIRFRESSLFPSRSRSSWASSGRFGARTYG